MKSRVQKWGNSLALRIPKSFAAEVGLEADSSVELSLEEGRLVVSPILGPEVTLAQLLAHITEDNLHAELDAGPALGSEAW